MTLLFSVWKRTVYFWDKGKFNFRESNSKLSSEYLVLNCKWFLSLFNSCVFFITYVIVSFPWRWWRRGVWQYCKWWSKISTLSVHRSHLYNETGKKIIKYITLFPYYPVLSPTLRKLIAFMKNKVLLRTYMQQSLLQLNFRLASFMLCHAAYHHFTFFFCLKCNLSAISLDYSGTSFSFWNMKH